MSTLSTYLDIYIYHILSTYPLQVIIASCYAVIVITIWRKGQTMQPPRVTQSLLPRGQ